MSNNKTLPDGWPNRLLQVIVVAIIVGISIWTCCRIQEYKQLRKVQKEKSI